MLEGHYLFQYLGSAFKKGYNLANGIPVFKARFSAARITNRYYGRVGATIQLSDPDISQKCKMGDISRGVANTL
jgi:hypothetical protein